ncbi:MAG: cell division protein SepF [Acidimicrobiia bacterium]|nr:cell division protein SepF [Acidimicrobiia bacterium]
MASLWNKTLFYLGLVDEDDQQGAEYMEAPGGDVRPIEPPPPVGTEFQSQPQTQRPVSPVGQPRPTSSVRPPGTLAGRRVEPPAATRRTVSNDPSHAEAGLYVHPDTGTAEQAARRSEPESQIIVTRNFSDAQSLADAVRSGRSVVLDLRSTEPEMVRRIVDFASGLTYALDGRMSKTAQGVILVTPTGVTLGINEQERLARLGLFGGDQ